MFLVHSLPPPPEPGTPLKEYLESVCVAKYWLKWEWFWEQHIGANSELPQTQRYGLVVDGPISYGGGEEVYVLPIDPKKQEVIGEEYKGHRRALEKLADLDNAEDGISFALLTVMISLSESSGYYRRQLSPQKYKEFEALLSALWVYFNVRNLWNHATRRYTFTGFEQPVPI